MQEVIITNLYSLGIGALLFAISYLSNMCFSLFYNIKVLNCEFDRVKFLNGVLKLLTFTVGTLFLCLGISTLPIFLSQTGITISEEYTSVLSVTAVVSLFVVTSVKYLIESFNTMRSILSDKKES